MKFDTSSFSFVELRQVQQEQVNNLFKEEDRDVLRAIVTAAHGEQQHVHAEGLRKGECHGDRTTFARIVRRLLIHGLV